MIAAILELALFIASLVALFVTGVLDVSSSCGRHDVVPRELHAARRRGGRHRRHGPGRGGRRRRHRLAQRRRDKARPGQAGADRHHQAGLASLSLSFHSPFSLSLSLCLSPPSSNRSGALCLSDLSLSLSLSFFSVPLLNCHLIKTGWRVCVCLSSLPILPTRLMA